MITTHNSPPFDIRSLSIHAQSHILSHVSSSSPTKSAVRPFRALRAIGQYLSDILVSACCRVDIWLFSIRTFLPSPTP